MKFLFLSSDRDSPVYLNYKGGFEKINNFYFNSNDFKNFDAILLTSFREDISLIPHIKKNNSRSLIGLVDPRNNIIDTHIDLVDFFIIDSIEMKDYFARYNKPMLMYYEYPVITSQIKQHRDNKNIIIGYHGNKVHLNALYPNISNVLDLLKDKYNIEFWAMYNIKNLGLWNVGLPKKVHVKHIQWSYENYNKFLSKCDIGIVPNCVPIKNISNVKNKIGLSKRIFLDSDEDYLIRFKMLSNIGRIIIFSQLGIPVVSDMFPSSLQFINDEKNGFLAHHKGGWYSSLEKLIVSKSLRKKFSDNLSKSLKDVIDYDIQNQRFIEFINNYKANDSKFIDLDDREYNLKDKLNFEFNYYYQKIIKKLSKK